MKINMKIFKLGISNGLCFLFLLNYISFRSNISHKNLKIGYLCSEFLFFNDIL